MNNLSLFSIFLFLCTLLIDSSTLYEHSLFTVLIRLIIGVFSLFVLLKFKPGFISILFLVFTSLVLIPFGFGLYTLLGVSTALAVFNQNTLKIPRSELLFLVFWSLNAILMLIQITGSIPDICLFKDFGCYINVFSLHNIDNIYLPLGQLRPPGLFPSQIFMVIFLLSSYVYISMFSPLRCMIFKYILLINFLLTGSQVTIIFLALFIFGAGAFRLPKYSLMISLCYFIILSMNHPYLLNYNFSFESVTNLFYYNLVDREALFSIFITFLPYAILALGIIVFVSVTYFARISWLAIYTMALPCVLMPIPLLISPITSTFPGALMATFLILPLYCLANKKYSSLLT